MTEQRYECKAFKSRDELTTFMNWEITQGWSIKEHSLLLRGDNTGAFIVSVVFERAGRPPTVEKPKS